MALVGVGFGRSPRLQLGGDGIERVQGRPEERMSAAGWEKCVDVTCDGHVRNRPER